jgi:hypothetical protein
MSFVEAIHRRFSDGSHWIVFHHILHPIAFSFHDDGLGVMQQPIEQCRCQRGVIVKNLRSIFEDPIRSKDDGSLLIALTDNLEEQIGAVFINRQVSYYTSLMICRVKEARYDRVAACASFAQGAATGSSNTCKMVPSKAIKSFSIKPSFAWMYCSKGSFKRLQMATSFHGWPPTYHHIPPAPNESLFAIIGKGL